MNCSCWRNQQGRGLGECATPIACGILATTSEHLVEREDDGMGCIVGVLWSVGITGSVLLFVSLLVWWLA